MSGRTDGVARVSSACSYAARAGRTEHPGCSRCACPCHDVRAPSHLRQVYEDARARAAARRERRQDR